MIARMGEIVLRLAGIDADEVNSIARDVDRLASMIDPFRSLNSDEVLTVAIVVWCAREILRGRRAT